MTIKPVTVGDMLASHLISLMRINISKAGAEDGARLFLVVPTTGQGAIAMRTSTSA